MEEPGCEWVEGLEHEREVAPGLYGQAPGYEQVVDLGHDWVVVVLGSVLVVVLDWKVMSDYDWEAAPG